MNKRAQGEMPFLEQEMALAAIGPTFLPNDLEA